MGSPLSLHPSIAQHRYDELLQDPEKDVRMVALDMFPKFSLKARARHTSAFAQRLTEHEADDAVRMHAIAMLLVLDTTERLLCAEQVAHLVATDPSADVRACAADAFVQLDARERAPHLHTLATAVHSPATCDRQLILHVFTRMSNAEQIPHHKTLLAYVLRAVSLCAHAFHVWAAGGVGVWGMGVSILRLVRVSILRRVRLCTHAKWPFRFSAERGTLAGAYVRNAGTHNGAVTLQVRTRTSTVHGRLV